MSCRYLATLCVYCTLSDLNSSTSRRIRLISLSGVLLAKLDATGGVVVLIAGVGLHTAAVVLIKVFGGKSDWLSLSLIVIDKDLVDPRAVLLH